VPSIRTALSSPERRRSLLSISVGVAVALLAAWALARRMPALGSLARIAEGIAIGVGIALVLRTLRWRRG
jgi:hypothetical protein